jgi:ribosomal RNA assembly protein
MQETYSEYIRKILQNKKKIETELKVKITNKGKLVFINGKPENEFTTIQVIDAINLGFSIQKALLLKDEIILLQSIHIKDLTKRTDLERVRARIIGKQGKTLKTLNNLTGCEFSLKDNVIGIIGNTEEIEEAIQSVTSLIQGSKQGNVYAHAEKEMKKKRQQPMNIKNELKELK